MGSTLSHLAKLIDVIFVECYIGLYGREPNFCMPSNSNSFLYKDFPYVHRNCHIFLHFVMDERCLVGYVTLFFQ